MDDHAPPPLTLKATERVYAKGDVVDNNEVGICTVVEVRRQGKFILIQSANNDQYWIDLDEDPGALELVNIPPSGEVIWKGKTYVRLSNKPIGGVKGATDQNDTATHVWGDFQK